MSNWAVVYMYVCVMVNYTNKIYALKNEHRLFMKIVRG